MITLTDSQLHNSILELGHQFDDTEFELFGEDVWDSTRWDNYAWDAVANGVKPTWQDITLQYQLNQINDTRVSQLEHLRHVTEDRILENYGVAGIIEEVRLRLRGGHTEAQDAERERLRTRYSIIKAWIESTDRTLAELEALDLTNDANWAGETWPPNRGTL